MVFLEAHKFNAEAAEDKELSMKAGMTFRQFHALSTKLKNVDILSELERIDYYKRRLNRATNLNEPELKRWLINSWNTERVLHLNKEVLEHSQPAFAMQWVFPQAYYSVYASFMAHCRAVGHTEESHTPAMRRFGKLIEENKMPPSISFYCDGGLRYITYHGITKPQDMNSMEYDPTRPITIDNQICQFLKSTRKMRLQERAKQIKFFTRNGKPRKSLAKEHWQKVSDSLGSTTILDLLYRKRIKANYHDISTFNHHTFKGLQIWKCLCIIVHSLNIMNEAYIAKSIGHNRYDQILKDSRSQIADSHIEQRQGDILALLKRIA